MKKFNDFETLSTKKKVMTKLEVAHNKKTFKIFYILFIKRKIKN